MHAFAGNRWFLTVGMVLMVALIPGCDMRTADGAVATVPTESAAIEEPQPGLVNQGREIFRFDTFGDEQFWTDTLRMHEVVSTAVDPTTALKVGLKVDADVLPAGLIQSV